VHSGVARFDVARASSPTRRANPTPHVLAPSSFSNAADFRLPKDISQVGDLVVYLCHVHDGVAKRVAYTRITAAEAMADGFGLTRRWLTLRPVMAMAGAIKGKPLPALLVQVLLCPKEEIRVPKARSPSARRLSVAESSPESSPLSKRDSISAALGAVCGTIATSVGAHAIDPAKEKRKNALKGLNAAIDGVDLKDRDAAINNLDEAIEAAQTAKLGRSLVERAQRLRDELRLFGRLLKAQAREWKPKPEARSSLTLGAYEVRLHLYAARDLPASDDDGALDAYVVVKLGGVVGVRGTNP
jgi:hypothetical protein